MEDFGVSHIANNKALFEPQRENAFVFVVTDIDGILKPNAVEGGADNIIANAQETIKFSVVSAPVPTFTQEVLSIPVGNATIKAAGKPQFSDGNLVIREYIGVDSKSAILAWQALSGNIRNGNAVGNMADYKKDCYLLEYSQDGTKLIRTWRMVNCWVSGVSEGDFTMNSAGIKELTATITYDWAYLEQD